MYLGGAPPNMPPCSQWGAWFSLLITHGGIIGGTPLRWTRFVVSLKSWHRWYCTLHFSPSLDILISALMPKFCINLCCVCVCLAIFILYFILYTAILFYIFISIIFLYIFTDLHKQWMGEFSEREDFPNNQPNKRWSYYSSPGGRQGNPDAINCRTKIYDACHICQCWQWPVIGVGSSSWLGGGPNESRASDGARQ